MSVTVTTDEEVNPLIQQVWVGVSMSVADRNVPASPATNGVPPVTVKVRVAPAPVNVQVIPVCSTRLFIRVSMKLLPDTALIFANVEKFQVPAGMEVRQRAPETNRSRNATPPFISASALATFIVSA